MNKNLDFEYYKWLCTFTRPRKKINTPIKTYNKLLEMLHYEEFVPMVPHDENRVEDGLCLRLRFSREFGVNYEPSDRCSILEMMIALALRCEEQIMEDPDIGNRTSQWFWLMIRNLGLFSYSDDKFTDRTAKIVEDKIDAFINREYEINGKGGLFVVDDCRHDMRKVEIWYQMCWYLDSLV